MEAIKERKTMAELTQEYGVQAGQIKEWKQKLPESLPGMFYASSRRQCQLVGLYWSTYHFKPENGDKW